MSTLPRELAPGVHWLGACLEVGDAAHPLHTYHSTYLVVGDDSSVLVDGGHPKDRVEIDRQLDALLARGAPAPRYLFATHSETPHAGGLGRLLDRFPDALACGDVSDLHLVFPRHEDRLRPLDRGDELDLGGTKLQVVEAVIRDYVCTRWAFDTARRVLFTSDGFAYTHHHRVGQCGCVAEEVPALDIPDMTALFAELALYWTCFTELRPYLDRLEALLFDELDVALIAPAHGLPVTNPRATLPRFRQGLTRR